MTECVAFLCDHMACVGVNQRVCVCVCKQDCSKTSKPLNQLETLGVCVCVCVISSLLVCSLMLRRTTSCSQWIT